MRTINNNFPTTDTIPHTSLWLSRQNLKTNSALHSHTLSTCSRKTILRQGRTYIIRYRLIWGSAWRTTRLKVGGEVVWGNTFAILMSSRRSKFISRSWRKGPLSWPNYTVNSEMDAHDKSSSTGTNRLRHKSVSSIKIFQIKQQNKQEHENQHINKLTNKWGNIT